MCIRDRLEIHRDAIHPGERVLIIDDVLATGGTAAATARLVEKLGGVVAGFSFVMELAFLHGRDALPGHQVHSLVTYGADGLPVAGAGAGIGRAPGAGE